MMPDVVLGEPRALWALVLAAPVVAAHLYRKRRRRLEVAFVPMLREGLGPTRALGFWRRLTDVARLACRVAALACLALALAAPRPVHAAVPVQDLFVVLDSDASVDAVEARLPGGLVETRLDRAVALAAAHVRAHASGRVGVILAGPAPRVLAALSDDREAAVAALERVTAAGPGRGDLAGAIRLAASARVGDRRLRTLVVGSRALPPGGGDDVEAVGAGETSDDQGLAQATLSSADDEGHATLRVEVRSASDHDVRRSLAIGFRGAPQPLERRELAVPARGGVEARFEVRAPRGGGLLVASLEGDDAYPANDVQAVWVEAPTRPSVLVVSEGSPRPFVRAVLDALGDQIDRAASGITSPADLARAAPRDVTIVDGPVGVAPPPSSGGWIFLAPFLAGPTSGLPFRIGREVREPLVWRTETSSPLLRGVDLSTAFVARATTILPGPAGAAPSGLAYVEGEAVVAEGTAGAARWLAFGLDPDGSDLPLRAALPVLLRNAIRRLGTAPRNPLKGAFRAGEPIVPRSPWADPVPTAVVEAVGRSRLRTVREDRAARARGAGALGGAVSPIPSEDPRPVAVGDGGAVMIPPGQGPALVTFARGERVLGRTTVLDLDPDLDLRPVRPPAPVPPPAGPSPEDEASRWLRWLLALAAGFLGFDLLLGTRRPDGKVVAVPRTA